MTGNALDPCITRSPAAMILTRYNKCVLVFSPVKTHISLLNITFIFDRYHCSWAAVIPAKYECDSKNPTSTFEISNFSITEKLTNGALVTPTPGHVCYRLMVVICMQARMSKDISSVDVCKSYWFIPALYVFTAIWANECILVKKTTWDCVLANIWVRLRNCGCLVTWFCYQLIAKPGNKTAAVSWPDSYHATIFNDCMS